MNLPPVRELLVSAGAAVLTYFALVALAQGLRRWRDVRFRWVFHPFALAAGLLVGVHVAPGGDAEWRVAALSHLTAITIVLAAFPLVTLLNRALWLRRPAPGKPAEAPRVLIDATGILVVAVAVLAALQFVYDIKVPGLLAGSGVAAIVLGLAMQDLLGNLIAGISLHFQKDFRPGDWLLIGDTHAKVVEISWRSTQFLTTDDVLIDVPNGDIAKQTITNFQLPTPRHAVRAQIGLHYDLPPARVQAVLKEAAATVAGVCAEPAPVVYLKDFADSAIVYEIKVWIDDHALMSRVLSEVRSHAWYALKRAGMEIPYPQLTLHRAKPADDGAAARAVATDALRRHKVLGALPGEQLAALVARSPVVLFATGEHVIEQGAAGESMFLLVRGAVDVRIARDGATTTVARLGTGDCFGEMSLLTGEPRTATVVAAGEVETVEVPKAAFAVLVREHPAVLEKLSELLAQRQLANAQLAAAAQAPVEQVRSTIRRKLRVFFLLED